MRSFLYSVLLVVILACNNNMSNNKKEDAFEIQYDSIITKNCESQKEYSYKYYISSKNKNNKSLSAIIIYDPQGQSKKAIKKYKLLADKYNVVLFASDNSRNGLQNQDYENIIKSMYNDILGNFSVNSANIYAMGFSGGAKAAIQTAFSFDLNAVITCSGGLSAENAKNNIPFAVYSMVGENDFNYVEIRLLDKSIQETKTDYASQYFDGIHEWAPFNEVEKAYLWAEMQSCINANKQPEKILLDNAFKTLTFTDELNENNKYNALLMIKNTFEKFVNVDSFKKELKTLKESIDKTKKNQTEEKLLAEERKSQQTYIDYFESKDIEWWQNEIVKLNNKKSPKNQQSERLKSYLSMVAFIRANAAIEQGQSNQMIQTCLKQYSIIDNKNPDVEWLYAIYFAKQGDKINSIKYLQNAVVKGLDDISKLEKPILKEVLGMESEYLKLCEDLRKNFL